MSSYCSPFNSLKQRCIAKVCQGVGSQQSIPSWYAGQKLSDTLACLARQSSFALPFSNTLSAPSNVCKSSSLPSLLFSIQINNILFVLFFGTLHSHTHLSDELFHARGSSVSRTSAHQGRDCVLLSPQRER